MSCECSKRCNSNVTVGIKPLKLSCLDIDPNLLRDLKLKVICEFLKLLRLIEKGHKIDYEFILEEISLINLIDDGDMNIEDAIFYLQYYLNNEFIANFYITDIINGKIKY